MPAQTRAQQDCLVAIGLLDSRSQEASTNALAASLGVTPPTVTSMLKRLAAAGLVRHTPYHGVELTARGNRAAGSVLRRHRLLETFLVQVLGYGWDEVHEEADRLEHAVSDRFVERLEDLLGHPQRDPHGDPIPTPHGGVAKQPHVSIVDLPQGERALVTQMADEEPEFLRFAQSIGMVPGASVAVLGHGPFDDPLEVSVAGRKHNLSAALARRVLVRRPAKGNRSRKERG